MAGYRLIRIGDVCNGLATKARAQKSANKFKDDEFADMALGEIGKQHTDAIAFLEESQSLVGTEHKSADEAFKKIDALLKRSRLTDAENKKVAELVKGIKASFDKVEEDAGALDAALKQYTKGGWEKAMQALLGDKNEKLNKMLTELKDANTAEDKKHKQIGDIEKWVQTCDQKVEAAQKQANKDRAAVIAEVSADLENAATLMQKQAEGIDKLEKDAEKALATFAKLNKQKTWTKADAKDAQAALTTVKGAATRMRGAFKTMSTQFDDLLERGMESPEAAKKFKDRIQKAEKLVDGTEKRVDEYGKGADKYAVLAKKIEKEAA